MCDETDVASAINKDARSQLYWILHSKNSKFKDFTYINLVSRERVFYFTKKTSYVLFLGI